jgi:hypothetical protein
MMLTLRRFAREVMDVTSPAFTKPTRTRQGVTPVSPKPSVGEPSLTVIPQPPSPAAGGQQLGGAVEGERNAHPPPTKPAAGPSHAARVLASALYRGGLHVLARAQALGTTTEEMTAEQALQAIAA